MDPESNDFVELRRLLAFKRHERPPPGYFEGFPAEVIARIHSGEQIRDYSFFEALSWEAPWLQRLWSALETKPVYAGGFGLAVCGLLLAGVLLSESADPTLMAAPGAPPVIVDDTAQVANSVQMLGSSDAQLLSTEPVAPAQPRDSLFQRVKDASGAEPLLINAPGGNRP